MSTHILTHMVRVNFDLNEIEYFKLKHIVGEGNISITLRNYVKLLIDKENKNPNKSKIKKDFVEAEAKYKKLLTQIDLIKLEENKEAEEQEKERKEMLKIKGNTMRTYLHRIIK